MRIRSAWGVSADTDNCCVDSLWPIRVAMTLSGISLACLASILCSRLLAKFVLVMCALINLASD